MISNLLQDPGFLNHKKTRLLSTASAPEFKEASSRASNSVDINAHSDPSLSALDTKLDTSFEILCSKIESATESVNGNVSKAMNTSNEKVEELSTSLNIVVEYLDYQKSIYTANSAKLDKLMVLSEFISSELSSIKQSRTFGSDFDDVNSPLGDQKASKLSVNDTPSQLMESSVPFSTSHIQPFPMNKKCKRVVDLLQEWYEGLEGQPSIVERDKNDKNWRHNTAIRTFYSRRKRVIKLVKLMQEDSQNGFDKFSRTEIGQLLDCYLKAKKLNLASFCQGKLLYTDDFAQELLQLLKCQYLAKSSNLSSIS